MSNIVTVYELAHILKLCDKYLISKYQTNIESFIEMNIDNKVEVIMMVCMICLPTNSKKRNHYISDINIQFNL